MYQYKKRQDAKFEPVRKYYIHYRMGIGLIV